MKGSAIFRNSLCIMIMAVFLVQISGCGTLMYPERRGQKSGRIDAGVAVLDAVGLLFFIIPGVIAFAVDYATGAIYLPGSNHSSLQDDDIRVVRISPDRLNQETIREIVVRETGVSWATDLDKAEVYALKGTEDIRTRFAEMKKSGFRTSMNHARADMSVVITK